MNKIVRLSWFNIKKHKLETAAIFVLVMLCMLLIGSSLAGNKGIKAIFPSMMKNTGSYENYILIPSKDYDSEFENILRADERVEECGRAELLYSMSANYLDRNGRENALYMSFITKDNEARIQHSPIDSTLSDSEIAALDHPIYMPSALKDNPGYKEGDTFEMVFGTRKFAFTVAGFYETALFDTTMGGVKFIINDSDYHVLEGIFTKYVILGYNDNKGAGGEKLINDMIKSFEDYSNRDISSGFLAVIYEGLEMGVTYATDMLLAIMLVMAAVIIISVVIMIRFRIAGDIKEQIVAIGTLEALGYRAREITLSYVIEYLIISAAGVLFGIGGCFLLAPAFMHVGEIMSGHHCHMTVPFSPIAFTALVILAAVAVIAFIRANMVRKYPPVRALRKGLGDNRFGREHLPLRKTKKNVHLRMALKGFLSNFRQSIGVTVCITISSIAIITSFIMFCFFSGDMNAISMSAGMEMSDLRIELMGSGDAYALADELMEMPEVRKATPSSGFYSLVNMPDQNALMYPMAFSDFSVTENIFPMEGRFPEHDNEIMITNMFAREKKLKVGESVTLEYLNVQRKYIITGIVTSSTNGGINLYITEDGLKRIIPTYRPDIIELYLRDGIDANEFRYTLTEKYGRSIADVAQDKNENDTYEEKIKAEAERKIAQLMADYGVSHVEYSIQSGDTVISGNSSSFVISSIMNVGDILRTQLGALSIAIAICTTIFMLIAAFVVMIILFIIMESSVRKQRKEFGIMKGLGYTSKELMFQLAFRIMPAALFSIITGTVVSMAFIKFLIGFIGKVDVNMPAVIILDIILLVFCFGCAYIGARKIKKISVCELMTE